jgi:hypothetical protein
VSAPRRPPAPPPVHPFAGGASLAVVVRPACSCRTHSCRRANAWWRRSVNSSQTRCKTPCSRSRFLLHHRDACDRRRTAERSSRNTAEGCSHEDGRCLHHSCCVVVARSIRPSSRPSLTASTRQPPVSSPMSVSCPSAERSARRQRPAESRKQLSPTYWEWMLQEREEPRARPAENRCA